MSWRRLWGRAGRARLGEAFRGSWTTVASDRAQRELESSAKRDGAAGLPGQYDILLSQYEQHIKLAGQQYIQNSAEDMHKEDALIYPRFTEARKDYRDALLQYESKKTELGGRPVFIQMSPKVYWPLVSLMLVCEVFVNFQAFRTLFSAELDITALMASAVLAMILIFAAHSIGGAVQQRKSTGWAILLGVLTVGITFGLAYLRLSYISYENSTGMGPFERPKLNADMVTGFFVLFNLLFLALAAWLAAKLHDRDETYEQRYKTYLRARGKVVKLKQTRDGNQHDYLRDARDSVGLYRKLISSYRDLNMQSREVKATPRAWVDNTPQKLVELDEQAFALRDNVSGLEEETTSR